MSDVESKEELDALHAELLGEGEGIGDAPKDEHKSEFLGAEACSGLCGTVFDLIAARKGEHWQLKKEEAEALGGAVDAVLAKYVPAGVDEYGAEVSLILVVVAIITPRMGEDNGKA